VLASYTTYTAYWCLLKKVENDPRYDRKKAEYLLKSFVELHDHAIREKIAIVVEHFAEKVQGEIGGRAKAMIVTRSRLHAVRDKLAIDRYIKERGYDFRALVAFSGTVEDGGKPFTESGMNGLPETTRKRTSRLSRRRISTAKKSRIGSTPRSIPSSHASATFPRKSSGTSGVFSRITPACMRFLKWKGLEGSPDGDFFVRSGPGTVKLPPESASEYIRTRFPERRG
jgi:hypothetical protein